MVTSNLRIKNCEDENTISKAYLRLNENYLLLDQRNLVTLNFYGHK